MQEWNLPLGQQRVRYRLSYVEEGWRVVRWIKYDAEWEDETSIADACLDRRKAKNLVYTDLKNLRATLSG